MVGTRERDRRPLDEAMRPAGVHLGHGRHALPESVKAPPVQRVAMVLHMLRVIAFGSFFSSTRRVASLKAVT